MIQNPIAPLVEQLMKLPGVGAKSAQRLAFFFLSMSLQSVSQFSTTLVDIRRDIRYCTTCFNISLSETCHICQDTRRHQDRLCIVAEPRDIFAIERTRVFKGLYHVLGGLISPIDGVNPEELRLQELVSRLKSGGVQEIVLAINPTIEGDATVLYLTDLLKSFQIKMTQLAYGLPMGSDIDYADELTLERAFVDRSAVLETKPT